MFDYVRKHNKIMMIALFLVTLYLYMNANDPLRGISPNIGKDFNLSATKQFFFYGNSPGEYEIVFQV